MLQLLVYNLFLRLYKTVISLLAFRIPKAALWLNGRKNWQKNLQEAAIDRPVIWMHCASLGEFEQGRPVFERIRELYPKHYLLLSFFSPSGYEVRKNYSVADKVIYLPFGGKATAEEFLNIIKPQLVIWVKYEYWYHYLILLKERKVPVYLIAAIFRKSQPFFKFFGSLYRKMIQSFSHVFVQDENSASLLKTILPAERITVGGDTRFDRVVKIASEMKAVKEIEEFINNRTCLVAGSTWQEDIEIIDHFANTRKDLCFIIAPHEIEVESVNVITTLIPSAIRYSVYIEERETSNVLIIDNIGMLSKLYFYAHTCYIGGGFGNGIHNITEAAVYGKPVVFGPAFQKFREAKDLIRLKGAFSVQSALEFEAVMNRLLQEEELYQQACKASYNYVREQQGATEKIISKVLSDYQQGAGLL